MSRAAFAVPAHSKLAAHMLTLIATLLVSTSFPVVARITNKLDPILLTLARFVIASLLFAPFALSKPGPILPSPRQLARYGLLGGLMVGFFVCMFAALRSTSTLNTGALFTLIPGVGGLLAMVILSERLGLARYSALALGAIGALWVVFQGDWRMLLAFQWNRGDLIFLVGCLMFALYGPLVPLFYRGQSMVVFTFWTLLFGSFWLVIISLAGFASFDFSRIDGQVYLGVFYLAIVTTLITSLIFTYCNVRLGPTRVMGYSYLNPALVLGMSLLMGEPPPSLLILPGIAIITIATVVLETSKNGSP